MSFFLQSSLIAESEYRFSRDSSDGRRAGGKYYTAPTVLEVKQPESSLWDQTASERDAMGMGGGQVILSVQSSYAFPPSSRGPQHTIFAAQNQQIEATRCTYQRVGGSQQPLSSSPPCSFPLDLLSIDTTRSPAVASNLAAVMALNEESPVEGVKAGALCGAQRKALIKQVECSHPSDFCSDINFMCRALTLAPSTSPL
jgi:hypothetical protein